MLLEEQNNFNVVNTMENWSDIEVLILTSGGVLEKDRSRVQAFLDRGGKVLAMGEGVFVDGNAFIDIGATYLGEASYDVDYTIIKDPLSFEIVSSPFLNYSPALRVKPDEDTEVLAKIREPYFSRTLDHYSSHKNTPFKLEDASHPAVIRKNNEIYIAHDLDKQYFREGARIQRQLFINALNILRENPMVEVEMPSMGRINLLKQSHKNRYVVHLLYASPIQRGSVRVVEDLIPLQNVPLTIDLEETVKKAHMIPSGKKLKLKKLNGQLQVVVPDFTCHTGVVFEY